MSREARDRVWAKSEQEGSRMLVMLALAEFADKSGLCFPGDEELAKRCRMKERNMQYVLKELEGSGEILKIRRPGRGLRSYTLVTVGLSTRRIYAALRRNNYPDLDIDKSTAKKLINDWLKGAEDCTNLEKVQSAKRCNPALEKVQSDAEKVQSSVEKGAIQRPPYKEEPSGAVIEPSIEPSSGDGEQRRAGGEVADCPNCKRPAKLQPSNGPPMVKCEKCGFQRLDGSDAKGKGRKAAKAIYLPNDEYCAVFKEAYLSEYKFTYLPDGGDLLQYRRMRQQRNGELTIEKWRQAVANFLATPREQHHLRELCVRFPEFHKHALDRFGKPVGADGGSNGRVDKIVGGAKPVEGKYASRSGR